MLHDLLTDPIWQRAVDGKTPLLEYYMHLKETDHKPPNHLDRLSDGRLLRDTTTEAVAAVLPKRLKLIPVATVQESLTAALQNKNVLVVAFMNAFTAH